MNKIVALKIQTIYWCGDLEKTTPKGTTTYTYNTYGALTKVILPNNTTIDYILDPLNRRIAKEVNGTITQKYLWKDLTTLLAIYDKDDNLIQRFEYADSRVPIAMVDSNNNRYYLHLDPVGSLRAVTDSNHNIIKEITYDSYGNILIDTNPSFKVPFGFAGGLYDEDTKLTHFGYREYDPFTGKWTAKDPLLFGGGDSNLYGYVLNDPVNLVDPWGLKWWNPFSWFSKEASKDTMDKALKKSYCKAMKQGSWACDNVKDGYSTTCGHPMSPCHESWATYWGSCCVNTLKCGEENATNK